MPSFLACKGTALAFCAFSEAVRSPHIITRSCLLWAAEVRRHDSEELSCCRSHPHGCRVGHQLRDPECHRRVVWEGRNKRQGGKFTLGSVMLCTACDPDKGLRTYRLKSGTRGCQTFQSWLLIRIIMIVHMLSVWTVTGEWVNYGKPEINLSIIWKFSSSYKNSASLRRTKQLLFFREAIAVDFANHTLYINTVCGQITEFLGVKAVDIYIYIYIYIYVVNSLLDS
jgi:hypothetical protein